MSNAPWFGAAVAVPFVAIAANSTADYLQQLDTKLPASEHSIVIENLIGDALVIPAAGGETQVTGTIHIAGGNDALARETAQAIHFEVDGGHIAVRYPDVREICALPGRSRSDTSTHTQYLGRRLSIETGTSPGRCLRVDLVVRLPADRELTFKTQIGEIEARELKADVVFDTGSGAVSVAKHEGSLDVDTGSGDVKIDTARGKVLVDTGSGDVDVTDANGRVNVDTGSGDVRLKGAHGDVRVDTGSGDVNLVGFTDGADLDIDTGSGDADVEGDLSQVRRLRVDTGNGDITVVTRTAVSLELEADSGSGRVTIDVPGARVNQTERSHAEATLGGGAGRGKLDAGSGAIKFSQTAAH
jgi:ferric-dicitrate binding protein FerR (iron transport regulator)